MACEVCEHCQGLVSRAEVVIREGFSYHKKCHKCYVCSETNLTNADVFKGAIFCSSCAQRIFQGCSTAKRTKNTKSRKRQRSRSRRRRDRVRTQDRRAELAKVQNGIIELAGLAGSSDGDSRCNSDELKETGQLSKTLAISTELALQVGKQIYEENMKSMEKRSAEMGVTTDITQELLQQMHCPVVNNKTKCTSPKRRPRQKKTEPRRRNKLSCSDLRVAELGMSTEIANMTLKNKSELPVIIKSDSPFRLVKSLSPSILNQESDTSGKGDSEKWLESTNTSVGVSMRSGLQVLREATTTMYSCPLRNQPPYSSNWMDRRLGSILQMPYKCFKRNILHRSSQISMQLSNTKNDFTLAKRLKALLHEEIADHQHRGVKKLYSTIIRERKPYKLGWLQLVTNASTIRLNHTMIQKRCQHFRTSHSYRCMRTKVMRLAGPTKSELAGFRTKMKSLMVPAFIKNVIEYNNKYAAIMMSQACGSEPV